MCERRNSCHFGIVIRDHQCLHKMQLIIIFELRRISENAKKNCLVVHIIHFCIYLSLQNNDCGAFHTCQAYDFNCCQKHKR